ncbi:MAG: F0F1 ATP synthase subunit A [Elusimicrobia bacterium]|nr:F0F1 ATP synthase subunit A [Elusimicrobiota bacterium]
MDFKEVLEHHILDHVYFRLPAFGILDLPFSKHLVVMWIAAALLVLTGWLAKRQGSAGLVVRGALESVVVYLKDEVVLPSLGPEGWAYLHYFCTLFFFILFCNLLGLIPMSATATGNISVTLALAATTFCMIHIAGVREQGLGHYLHSIVPAGLPLWLIPPMYFVEFIGFMTKSFALCIRLFMNMIAGHIVMLAFFALILIFGKLNPWIGIGVTAPFSIVLVLFVLMLEIFVAFLQAYIFTFLTALFVGAAVHPQH